MSNPVERRPPGEPRRGLQSVVKLYLSRPPRRALDTAQTEEPAGTSASGSFGEDLDATAASGAVSSAAAPSTPRTEPPRAAPPSRMRIEPGYMRPYVGWDEGPGDEPAPIEGAEAGADRKGRLPVDAHAIPGEAAFDARTRDAETRDAEVRDAEVRDAKTQDARTRDARRQAAETLDAETQNEEGRIADARDADGRIARTRDEEARAAAGLRAYQDGPRAEAAAFSETADADFDDDAVDDSEAPEPVLSGISLDTEDFDAPVPDPRGDDLLSEIVEDALPAQEIGAEALRAELAFKLEEHWGIGDDADDIGLAAGAAQEARATGAFVDAGSIPDVARRADAAIEPWATKECSAEGPADGGHEFEALFEEDAAVTGVVEDPGATIAEIFDMVDRALALGPASVIDVAAMEEASVDVAPAPEEANAALLDAPEETVRSPRVVLLLSTLPPRLRRRLLDTLAAPVVTLGRRTLFLESDPSDEETGGLIEEALGLDTAVWRRSLGASPREILLMRPSQRAQLFTGLAAEERRSELVLVGVGLPESIFCPRLLHLVDTVVVGLSPQESSLYEAYRALRAVPERRPGITPYVVTLASSAEEAVLLFERFRGIASDFLRMPILEGGWLELTARPEDARAAGRMPGAQDPPPGIAPELLELLATEMGARGFQKRDAEDAVDTEDADGSIEWPEAAVPEVPRAFFERLADWFGPT